jgi:hypothetical protein
MFFILSEKPSFSLIVGHASAKLKHIFLPNKSAPDTGTSFNLYFQNSSLNDK